MGEMPTLERTLDTHPTNLSYFPVFAHRASSGTHSSLANWILHTKRKQKDLETAVDLTSTKINQWFGMVMVKMRMVTLLLVFSTTRTVSHCYLPGKRFLQYLRTQMLDMYIG